MAEPGPRQCLTRQLLEVIESQAEIENSGTKSHTPQLLTQVPSSEVACTQTSHAEKVSEGAAPGLKGFLLRRTGGLHGLRGSQRGALTCSCTLNCMGLHVMIVDE